jgi:uncharacterized membrane protein YedE/YeeE
MYTPATFVSGLVFGLGLIVACMSNPAKALGIPDLGGAWDPSLALVMSGAIAVGAGAFAAKRGPRAIPARRARAAADRARGFDAGQLAVSNCSSCSCSASHSDSSCASSRTR